LQKIKNNFRKLFFHRKDDSGGGTGREHGWVRVLEECIFVHLSMAETPCQCLGSAKTSLLMYLFL